MKGRTFQSKNQSKVIGLFFGGGAGFFSYYIGISKFIIETYNLDNVLFAGVSAGSLAAIYLCLGRTNDTNFLNDVIHEGLDDLRHKNSSNGLFFKDGVIGPEGIKILKKKLTKAIQESNKFQEIQNKCTIIATRLDGINPVTEYIKNWNSIHELVDCITASCWVPLVFGNISTKFRGSNYIDGGVPFLFNKEKMNDEENDWIKIDLYTFNRFQENALQSALNLGALCFSANDIFTTHLIDMGYNDAKKHPEIFYKLERKF